MSYDEKIVGMITKAAYGAMRDYGEAVLSTDLPERMPLGVDGNLRELTKYIIDNQHKSAGQVHRHWCVGIDSYRNLPLEEAHVWVFKVVVSNLVMLWDVSDDPSVSKKAQKEAWSALKEEVEPAEEEEEEEEVPDTMCIAGITLPIGAWEELLTTRAVDGRIGDLGWRLGTNGEMLYFRFIADVDGSSKPVIIRRAFIRDMLERYEGNLPFEQQQEAEVEAEGQQEMGSEALETLKTIYHSVCHLEREVVSLSCRLLGLLQDAQALKKALSDLQNGS
jgi:hypothetical protein